MTFEIIDGNYKSVSNGLNKSEILYAFIEKKAGKSGCFIKDAGGVSMKFNEFMQMYID